MSMLAMSFLASSCTEESKTVCWGETEWYSDFLFFDFNDDAKQMLNEEVPFALYDGDCSQPVPEKEARLIVDGEECPDNKFSVGKTTESVSVGIVLNRDIPDGGHKYVLALTKPSLLNRLNNDEVGKTGVACAASFVVNKKQVMNPLAFGLMVFGLVVLAALLVWFVVLRRLFYPVISVKRIEVLSQGAESGYCKTPNVGGKRRVVFRKSNAGEQGALSRLFTGEILYLHDARWEDEWEIVPGRRKSIRVLTRSKYLLGGASTIKQGQTQSMTHVSDGARYTIKVC